MELGFRGLTQCCSSLFYRLAIAANEHALIEQSLERAQGPGLMKSALVATHRAHVGGPTKRRTTFFGLVSQPISGNFCYFRFAHISYFLSK